MKLVEPLTRLFTPQLPTQRWTHLRDLGDCLTRGRRRVVIRPESHNRGRSGVRLPGDREEDVNLVDVRGHSKQPDFHRTASIRFDQFANFGRRVRGRLPSFAVDAIEPANHHGITLYYFQRRAEHGVRERRPGSQAVGRRRPQQLFLCRRVRQEGAERRNPDRVAARERVRLNPPKRRVISIRLVREVGVLRRIVKDQCARIEGSSRQVRPARAADFLRPPEASGISLYRLAKGTLGRTLDGETLS